MNWLLTNKNKRLTPENSKELEYIKKQVADSPWRQVFHIQPESGLLNDPNGFAFFNGEYHLFYQWYPFGPVHGLKHWYHLTSENLVDWKSHGAALAPDIYEDRHGVYSGSGLAVKEKLYLFYTGNTKLDNGERVPFQCSCAMRTDGTFEEKKVLMEGAPEGYTPHFRDPKVWQAEDGMYYAVIGGQRVDLTGAILLYVSADLETWECKGEVQTSLPSFGYMWECPDYFEIQGNGILMFSPQGIEAEGDSFQNIYQSGYIMGEPLDLASGRLEHGAFREWDHGFDFYAPQTTESPYGRRILIGWMGLPDQSYPTDRFGWAHCLTLPREIVFENGELRQQPVKELKNKRNEAEHQTWNNADELMDGQAYELDIRFDSLPDTPFSLHVREGRQERTTLHYDPRDRKLVLDRSDSGEPLNEEYGTTRAALLSYPLATLRIFVDVSSIEIFANDGECVFTSRIFPKEDSNGIRMQADAGGLVFHAEKWEYK
ncbi:beta-fructofuranosidase [Sinobaca qinghaiensis]|uniref:Sucrose-6-phosphate hydrolase n=1 Tax=Sinobaca qinghaiensis TaxID=342944 RepID=A0A419V7U1_9BACL|nr:sucrose-6-phosphate hydrolase [Sinobaca qinghaiensis]RKD76135.1 beta-fructofuranosidase [Sinobaca qinghaiensis]